MNDAILMTAEQFAARDIDFPQGGRWMELAAGRLVTLEPPDPLHGCVVLNLSKALAGYLQGSPVARRGYACYELGLVVARHPDTVWCPAVSYFSGQSLFAEIDSTITDTRPLLVVEVASTNDRRRDVSRRVMKYLAWGVAAVWVVDPLDRLVSIFAGDVSAQRYSEAERFTGDPPLSGFEMPVADLFVQPV